MYKYDPKFGCFIPKENQLQESCKRNRQHHLTQTQKAGLERGNSASSFSLGAAGVALNNI